MLGVCRGCRVLEAYFRCVGQKVTALHVAHKASVSDTKGCDGFAESADPILSHRSSQMEGILSHHHAGAVLAVLANLTFTFMDAFAQRVLQLGLSPGELAIVRMVGLALPFPKTLADRTADYHIFWGCAILILPEAFCTGLPLRSDGRKSASLAPWSCNRGVGDPFLRRPRVSDHLRGGYDIPYLSVPCGYFVLSTPR